ncbi:hypothetical protein AMAG_19246 [Allomyces macrogynus ATCC 38327]|uniref:Helicase C-terminal domain-containing protein n=1 Tax=Allomyces macrogynus (strain ATCC 38327) TaxID=578462 RepID=A0A0L0SPY4_ALLM3|nr:hypothetical protein AMAG_19246 [Allomyces macrogynus ATCC 38327]|eukprot:KNE64542.1 hypothetical protein AMAG_19246 [Allomyces macrogynus ATCC 38327]
MEFISAVYKPTKINEHLAGHVNVVRNTLPEDFQPRVMSKLTGRHVNGEAVSDETFFKMNILNDLSQGKKLYVFIPRKVDNKGIWSVQSFGEYLARQFDWTIGKQIKVYHGDRPQHELKELIDPDSVWASDEVRVVVANTKLTVGVNFSLRNVFDKVYARYEDWVAPRDFFQAIYRIRHPKDNEIVYMSTQGQKNGLTTRLKPIDISEVREMHSAIIKNAQLEMDMNESASSASVFEVFRKMACINIRAGPDYFYDLNPGLKAVEECGALTCLWKNIDEVEEEVLEHHFNTDDDEPSWETWLGIRKFMFKGHYGKYLGEDDMAALWNYRGKDFFDQCSKFYKSDKNHVLHKVIAHNAIKIGEDEDFPVTAHVPEHLRLALSSDFKQVALLKSLNATTIMKMFNVYFGKRVLEQDSNKHRVWIERKPYPNIKWTDEGADLFRLYHLYTTGIEEEKQGKTAFVLELSEEEDEE